MHFRLATPREKHAQNRQRWIHAPTPTPTPTPWRLGSGAAVQLWHLLSRTCMATQELAAGKKKKLADRRCCCIVPQLEGDQQVRSRCQQLAVSEAVQSKTEHTQQLDNAARRRNRNAVVEASLYYAGASGRQTEGSKWRSGERRGEKVVW